MAVARGSRAPRWRLSRTTYVKGADKLDLQRDRQGRPAILSRQEVAGDAGENGARGFDRARIGPAVALEGRRADGAGSSRHGQTCA